ncbi:hypothetical protein AAMO2058_001485000 [Amorphochlora amoebiformis]
MVSYSRQWVSSSMRLAWCLAGKISRSCGLESAFLRIARLSWPMLYFAYQLVVPRLIGFALRLPMKPLFWIRNRDEYIPTPDGVKLAAHIISPIGREPRPALLIRTPYSQWLMYILCERFAERGMHVIVCDSRGRFSSDGEFSFLANEKRDAKATLDWLSEQKWFNGDLALLGVSYDGFCLWATVAAYLENPPNPRLRLKACIPIFTSSDLGKRGMFNGGIFQLELAARYTHLQTRLSKASTYMHSECLWVWKMLFTIFKEQKGPKWNQAMYQLPLKDLDAAILGEKVTEGAKLEIHPRPEHEYWDNRDHSTALRNLGRMMRGEMKTTHELPQILFCAGFYDLFDDAMFGDFMTLTNGMEAIPPHLNLIGVPMHHFEDQACFVQFGVRFVLKHLLNKPNMFDGLPLKPEPILVFPIGKCEKKRVRRCSVLSRNYNAFLARHFPAYREGDFRCIHEKTGWKPLKTWPPPSQDQEIWLTDSYGLRWGTDMARPNPGKLSWVYDPKDPTPSIGGCIFHPRAAGPRDNSIIERMRKDILVFSSSKLTDTIEIGGRVTVELFISSTAPTFDVFARLCKIQNNKSINLCDGIVRVVDSKEKSKPYGMERIPSLGRRRVSKFADFGLNSGKKNGTPQWQLNEHSIYVLEEEEGDKDTEGPGKVRKVRIQMNPIVARIGGDCRIGLQVSSGAFPRFARNLGYGGDLASETLMRPATQTIHLGLSRLLLPILTV